MAMSRVWPKPAEVVGFGWLASHCRGGPSTSTTTSTPVGHLTLDESESDLRDATTDRRKGLLQQRSEITE